jgi:hypothetical protein
MAKSDHGKPARIGWSRAYEEAWDRLNKSEKDEDKDEEDTKHPTGT